MDITYTQYYRDSVVNVCYINRCDNNKWNRGLVNLIKTS